MVYAYFKKHHAEFAIEQSQQVITNLQWILDNLLMEQDRINEAVQKQNYRLQKYPENSFNYSISKSVMSMELIENFNAWLENKQICQLLERINYICYNLKLQLNKLVVNSISLANGQGDYDDDNFIIVTTNDFMVVENGIYVYKNADSIFEFEEDELAECYNWMNKINERKDLIAKIDVIRSLIKNTYCTICSTFCQVLNDCCIKFQQHLGDYDDNLRTLAEDTYCKLKQLLVQISEEEINRYFDKVDG